MRWRSSSSIPLRPVTLERRHLSRTHTRRVGRSASHPVPTVAVWPGWCPNPPVLRDGDGEVCWGCSLLLPASGGALVNGSSDIARRREGT